MRVCSAGSSACAWRFLPSAIGVERGSRGAYFRTEEQARAFIEQWPRIINLARIDFVADRIPTQGQAW
jgi:hypothetical protein